MGKGEAQQEHQSSSPMSEAAYVPTRDISPETLEEISAKKLDELGGLTSTLEKEPLPSDDREITPEDEAYVELTHELDEAVKKGLN